jgi:hypothetical protein
MWLFKFIRAFFGVMQLMLFSPKLGRRPVVLTKLAGEMARILIADG